MSIGLDLCDAGAPTPVARSTDLTAFRVASASALLLLPRPIQEHACGPKSTGSSCRMKTRVGLHSGRLPIPPCVLKFASRSPRLNHAR